ITGNIHPVGLWCRAGAEVKADPDVGIVGAKHGHTRILRRVLDLVNIRTVPQGLLGHVLGSRGVRYVPAARIHCGVAAGDGLKYPRAGCNEVTATARNTGRRAIVAARDAAVKKIIWHHERPRIARPGTRHAAPGSSWICAITHTTRHGTTVVALEKTKV